MSWPLKHTYKDTNKETVANARAMQLNTVIEALVKIISNCKESEDSATLVSLTESFVELQRQYKKLQEEFFTGDGRSYRKNRGKKKGADLSKLLK
jgi:hypothetical protein